MKDIHEVKDTQQHSFDHVCSKSVAAEAGSVHLVYSMDRKLDRARIHLPAPSYFSRTLGPLLQPDSFHLAQLVSKTSDMRMEGAY